MNFRVLGSYLLICLIWGTTWLAIRIGLETLTPVYSAGLRFLTASVILFLYIKIRKLTVNTDSKSLIIYLMMALFTFIVPFSLIYWGQQHVASGIASVLFSVYPFFVAIFSKVAFRDEKIGVAKVFSLLIGFSGIILLFVDKLNFGLNNSVLGMLAIVMGGFLQAFAVIIIKKYGKHLNVVTMNFLPITLGALVLIPVGLLTEDVASINYTAESFLSILYLGVFGTLITFSAYYWLLKKINIVLLSLVAFITPIIALIFGWIFYNESLNTLQMFGTLLILFSLTLASIKPSSLKFLRINKVS